MDTRLSATRATAALATLTILVAGFAPLALASEVPTTYIWGDRQLLWGEGNGRFNTIVKVGEDAQGNRIATWIDLTIGYTVFVSYAPAGGAWVRPISVDNPQPSGRYIADLQLAVSPNGDAVVAWLEEDRYVYAPTLWGVGAAHYRHASGWSTNMITVGDLVADAGAPRVAIDADGNSAIVWTQIRDHGGANETDVLARFHSGTWVNWTSATTLDTLAGVADAPDVTIDPTGLAVAAWIQHDGANVSLYSSVFDGISSWSAPEPRENSPENVGLLAMHGGANGEAVLAWTQGPSAAQQVRAARFAAGAWESAVTLDSTAGTPGAISVGANRAGAACVAWQSDSSGDKLVRAAVFDPASGWSGKADLENTTFASRLSRVVVDGSGNAMFLWNGLQNTYYGAVMMERYVAGLGWQAVSQVGGASDYYPGDIAVNEAGWGSAVFRGFDGLAVRMFEMQYLPVDVIPPALTVSPPTDGAVTTQAFVTVRGTTEPGALVTINGQPVFVNDTGGFAAAVQVPLGGSTVTIVATDAAGNPTTVGVAVTYNDPAAGLSASIEALQAAVDELAKGSGGADLSALLNATRSDLGALQVEVAALNASSGGSGANASQISARLDALSQRLDALQTRQNETSAVASSAQAGAGAGAIGLGVGLLGAALGAAGLLMARRAGGRRPSSGDGSMPPKGQS
jgi:hypothetical protein